MASKSGESSENNNEQDDELYNTKNVLQAKTPLQSQTVDKEGRSDASETNSSLVPAVDGNLRSIEDVFTKDDAVRSSPSEENNVSSLSASQSCVAIGELVTKHT